MRIDENRMIVFKNFRYRECDAFAAYLREQSAKGKHFKEWRMGLVFEKGEAADIVYEVEVFPKGSEWDTRPEGDTKEYAEYCDYAGWRLLDARKRFCIFRREIPDAVPIVTPEERFQNVRKAEYGRWRHGPLGSLTVAVIWWFSFWFFSFENYIFNDMEMFVLLMFTMMAIYSVCDVIGISLWSSKMKKRLAAGHVPVYESRWSGRHYEEVVYLAVVLLGGGLLAFRMHMGLAFLLAMVIVSGYLVLYYIVIPFKRPSRSMHKNLNRDANIGLLFLVVLGVLIIFLVLPDDSQDVAGRQESLVLTRSDDSENQDMPEFTDVGELHGILGDYTYYREEGSGEYMCYERYQTNRSWILNKIWKDNTKRLDDSMTSLADSKIWSANMAYMVKREDAQAVDYWMLYQDEVLYFSSNIELSSGQIQEICGKLNL